MTLDELTSAIIEKDQYKTLTFIGDNLSNDSVTEKIKIINLVNNNKNLLFNRLRDLMSAKHFNTVHSILYIYEL